MTHSDIRLASILFVMICAGILVGTMLYTYLPGLVAFILGIVAAFLIAFATSWIERKLLHEFDDTTQGSSDQTASSSDIL